MWPREILSLDSAAGVSVACQPGPPWGAVKETLGKARGSGASASPSRGGGLVASGRAEICLQRLSGGRGEVGWFPGSAFSPKGKARALANRPGPSRELDPTFPFSVRPRWVSVNPPKKRGDSSGRVGPVLLHLLSLPSRLWPPYGMAFLTMAFSVSPEN